MQARREAREKQQRENAENIRRILKEESGPLIIFFDSLNDSAEPSHAKLLRSYLAQEYLHRNADNFGTPEQRKRLLDMMDEREIPHLKPELPKQDNAHDCGLFILEYFETFLEDPAYLLSNLTEAGLRNSLFTHMPMLLKRKYIEKLLIFL